MAELKFSLLGVEELKRKFSDVSDDMTKKGANAAARSAARLVAREAWKGANKIDDPKTAEDIAKNIWMGGAKYPGVKKNAKRYTPFDGVKYRVGVAGGAGGNLPSEAFNDLPGLDTRHWRYWEFGSENTPATPFLRPALSRNIGPAVNEFFKEFDKALARAVRKRAKQQ